MLLKLFILLLLLVQDQVLAGESHSSSSEEDGSSEHDDDEHEKSSSHEHRWGYEDQEAWRSAYHDCNGKSQSPIDIETSKAIYDRSLPAIKLDGYDLTDQPGLKLHNNGHTLQLSLPSSMRILKGFDEIYLAAQLHFHWGTIEVPGSEHTIDNVHFPAEIHVVHYNSKYADLAEAASKKDGLAVLGGFIGIGLHENENYEKILSALTDVSIEESDTMIPGFNIRHLLPNNLEKFYRYNGSLTTPPCFQTVNWTMFNDTITVSRRQLAALEKTLKAGQNQLLSKNFRAPQLLHGRRVLASFSTSPSVDSANTNTFTGEKSLPKVKTSGTFDDMSKGDVLAIAFGALFVMTLLGFSAYAYQQRKKYSKFKKDTRQNVIYKPATKEEV
ncbi:carbonic anhydrase 14-like [Astyanax mexicanus]|uniref:Carbonic anhydrase n=1 Tax=Astyanax mexicanus TaxID=7994 RepID=A0A8B9HEV5_ASTMX|nr:carbonic anhydrase 14-like [Astyanax mexicanus]